MRQTVGQVFIKIGWEGGADVVGTGYGPVAGCCECSDEPSGSGATESVSQ
jgi:hypothetical protein